MKKLDRYIIVKFLGTFFFSLVLFLAMAIVIDFTEKIDDFTEEKLSFAQIFGEYYLNFIPWIALMLTPLFIFIAIIFFTSKLAYRSEIVAMLNGGMSFYRLLFVPYFFSAAVLVGLQYYANHYLVPIANQKRITFEEKYIKKRRASKKKDIHIQIDQEHYVYLYSYNAQDSTGRHFTLERIKDKMLLYKLTAEKISWEKDKWKIESYHARHINQLEERIEKGATMDTVLNLHPSDFEEKIRFKEAMTTPELDKFIAKEKLKGSPFVAFYEVEKHTRTALPFATFFLTIIGFSLASRKVRGGTGFHLFVGITLSAAYIVFFRFSSTFSTNGSLPAILGAWIPNIIFGIVSIILMLRAQK